MKNGLPIVDRAVSSDGTQKLLLSLADGNSIEAVLTPRSLQEGDAAERWLNRARRVHVLPWHQLVRSVDLQRYGQQLVERVRGRHTAGYSACISTQVGCAIGCAFCRTASMGLLRNLTAEEILQQVITLRELVPVESLVMTGMGEPLQNLDAVLESCEGLQATLGYSRQQIIISTCGLVPAIYTLAERQPVRLTLSLNATTDGLRAQLMPGAKRWSIKQVLDACRHYSRQTRSAIGVEYVLLGGVNDTTDDAQRLAQLLRKIDAELLLVPFNDHPESRFRRPDSSTIDAFRKTLWRHGLPARVLTPGGRDISAAYGQLHSQALARSRGPDPTD